MIIEDEKKYLFQNYGRQPIVITRGEGSFVWDENEKQYLDFLGGLAVTSLGHTHPAVTAAIDEQSKKLVHTSNLYYTTPMITLAKNLVQLSGLDRVLFCNSGAEAVETAIKLARRWGHDLGNGAYEIISAEDGFHGRSLGALAATGTARYRCRHGLCLGFYPPAACRQGLLLTSQQCPKAPFRLHSRQNPRV